MWTRLVVLALLFAVPLAACGDPDPGDPCQMHACSEDGQSAFFCEGGFYEMVPCPSGCTEFQLPGQLWVSCALDGIIPGDACTTSAEGMVLCESQTKALVCRANLWARKQCAERCESGSRGGDDESDGICE